MADGGYFDEHDCRPLAEGQRPDHLAHLARLLVDTGYWNQSEFSALFSSRPPPPTSKAFVESLQEKVAASGQRKSGDEDGREVIFQCPICLKETLRSDEDEDKVFSLPCQHRFHVDCLKKWMEKTSTCPVCRFELPTDDPDYEEMKKQRKREEQRKQDIENLHDSMYG